MSQDQYLMDVAFIAATNLSSYQYQLAKPDSTGDHYVDVNDTANGFCYGVIYDKPQTNGDGVQVRVQGTAKIIADAAISAGVAVAASSNGKIFTSPLTGGYIIGYTLEASGAQDDVIEVLLTPGNFQL